MLYALAIVVNSGYRSLEEGNPNPAKEVLVKRRDLKRYSLSSLLKFMDHL